MIKKYKKKPIVIDAAQFDGDNHKEIIEFIGNSEITGFSDKIVIFTLEGDMTATIGDWIIKGIEGEFYPCKPEIFEQTYEEVTE